VQAVHGTLDGGRPDTSDAIFTIRRVASIRPNMESVSVVSVLRARLDREAPEPSVAARVAHRVSLLHWYNALLPSVFAALVFAES
jgi:hypothetical protein